MLGANRNVGRAAGLMVRVASPVLIGFAGASVEASEYPRSIEHQGLSHEYTLYVPDAALTLPPLVISLHGGGGDAEDWEETAQLRSAADRYGFVLLQPQGYAGTTGLLGRTWNAGACCGPARKDAVDHVGAISAMLDDAALLVAYDADRVLSLGHSNGGMMAYRLGCELSQRITAVAANAAYLMDRFYERGDSRDTAAPVFSCAPVRPVALLHMHGLEDACAPYQGGPAQTREWQASERPPVEDSIDVWRSAHACTGDAQETFAVPGARCQTYDGCNGGVDVTLCTVDEAGHVWPGSARYRPIVRASCRGSTTSLLDANTEIWEFLLRQPARALP